MTHDLQHLLTFFFGAGALGLGARGAEVEADRQQCQPQAGELQGPEFLPGAPECCGVDRGRMAEHADGVGVTGVGEVHVGVGDSVVVQGGGGPAQEVCLTVSTISLDDHEWSAALSLPLWIRQIEEVLCLLRSSHRYVYVDSLHTVLPGFSQIRPKFINARSYGQYEEESFCDSCVTHLWTYVCIHSSWSFCGSCEHAL